MTSLYDNIIEKLNNTFSPHLLELIDETHKHQKHRQFQSGKFHFKLHIASAKFATLSTVKAHQAIYACLGELMHSKIHALSIHIHKSQQQ